jgi:hypothetical protein
VERTEPEITKKMDTAMWPPVKKSRMKGKDANA